MKSDPSATKSAETAGEQFEYLTRRPRIYPVSETELDLLRSLSFWGRKKLIDRIISETNPAPSAPTRK